MALLSKRGVAWLTIVVAVVFGAGLLSGEFLEQYDARVGFDHEAEQIASELALSPGMVIGDLRAGNGRWTVYLARHVGASGLVFATAGPNPTHELLQTVARAGVDNVSVIAGAQGPNQSLLPSSCCDAVLVRAVFHHLVRDRGAVARELFDSIKPGGRLAVIEYDEGTKEFRNGHGIARQAVIRSMRAAGFELTDDNPNWPGHAYCVTFRRPKPARAAG